MQPSGCSVQGLRFPSFIRLYTVEETSTSGTSNSDNTVDCTEKIIGF